VVFIFNSFYIKEYFNEDELFDNDLKIPLFIKKILIKFFKIANIIIIKENIIILPYSKEKLMKISNRKFKIFFKKIHKYLEKENIKNLKTYNTTNNLKNNTKRNFSFDQARHIYNNDTFNTTKNLSTNRIINTVAISKNLNKLQNIETFKNLFYAKNYNILTGKWLFRHLSFEILQYLSKETNKPINEMEVSILTNSNSEIIKENIKLLAQNVKNLNIVTVNLEFYKSLAQELYNSFGISIRISNNKKKILVHSDIIFNFDYQEVLLNKFTLPLNGIIINYNNKIKIYNKLFNGLAIHSYTIDTHKDLIENFKSDYLLNSFDLEVLYESLYFNEISFTNMLYHFIEDKLIITSLLGNNGKISKKEINFVKNT